MIRDGNGWRMSTPEEDRAAYERFCRMMIFGIFKKIGVRVFLEARLSVVPSYECPYIEDWLKLHPEDREACEQAYAEADKRSITGLAKHRNRGENS